MMTADRQQTPEECISALRELAEQTALAEHKGTLLRAAELIQEGVDERRWDWYERRYEPYDD